jgi:hypothetical protein
VEHLLVAALEVAVDSAEALGFRGRRPFENLGIGIGVAAPDGDFNWVAFAVDVFRIRVHLVEQEHSDGIATDALPGLRAGELQEPAVKLFQQLRVAALA